MIGNVHSHLVWLDILWKKRDEKHHGISVCVTIQCTYVCRRAVEYILSSHLRIASHYFPEIKEILHYNFAKCDTLLPILLLIDDYSYQADNIHELICMFTCIWMFPWESHQNTKPFLSNEKRHHTHLSIFFIFHIRQTMQYGDLL